MRRPSITFWRRLSQPGFFIPIVYGGVLLTAELHGWFMPRITPEKGLPRTTTFEKGQILWATSDHPVFDTYPPSAACRYNPKGGLFKACIVHMIAENLTWRTAFRYFIPHFLIFIVLAFLVGRWWCGWACPLGTVGDLLGWIRRRLGMPYVSTPAGLRRGLRRTSYALLTGTFGISWLIGMKPFGTYQCALFLPYCQICPARILCPLFGGTAPGWRDFSSKIAGAFTLLSWVVLGLFLMAFFIGRRLWCHVCPIGLMTSWFNRGSALTVRKNEATHCNRCSACVDACPMGLTHVREEKQKTVLNDPQCIFCLRCVEQCPRDDCLDVRLFGRRLVRSSFRLPKPVTAQKDE